MLKQLAAYLHRSLRRSFGKCYSLFSAVTRVFLYLNGSYRLFPRLVGVLVSESVYLPCSPSSSVVLLVLPEGGVPVGGITVSALETLVQACIRDGRSGSVTHRQVSASNVPSQFGVASVRVAESSAKIALPRRSSGCQPRTRRAPLVAKQRRTVGN